MYRHATTPSKIYNVFYFYPSVPTTIRPCIKTTNNKAGILLVLELDSKAPKHSSGL